MEEGRQGGGQQAVDDGKTAVAPPKADEMANDEMAWATEQLKKEKERFEEEKQAFEAQQREAWQDHEEAVGEVEEAWKAYRALPVQAVDEKAAQPGRSSLYFETLDEAKGRLALDGNAGRVFLAA